MSLLFKSENDEAIYVKKATITISLPAKSTIDIEWAMSIYSNISTNSIGNLFVSIILVTYSILIIFVSCTSLFRLYVTLLFLSDQNPIEKEYCMYILVKYGWNS